MASYLSAGSTFFQGFKGIILNDRDLGEIGTLGFEPGGGLLESCAAVRDTPARGLLDQAFEGAVSGKYTPIFAEVGVV
jgi:hypothetical protein